MKRAALAVLIATMVGAGFGGGMWYARRGAAAPAVAKSERRILYWVDPMHPAYKSDKPGIAPDCGMKLVPVYNEGGAKAGPAGARDIDPETGNEVSPGGLNISAEKQQLIGVKYAVAAMAAGSETVRAVGRVAQDETKIVRIHPRTEGWIYKVHVDFTGQLANKGDPLLTIYSPEMLASQQEFLLALKARDTLKESPSREALENSELMIEAARRRLESWDLSAAQVAQVERTHTPIRSITLYSPSSGYVISRNAFPSQRVSPETELYAIADLSRVWILADVFESDISKVHAGQAAMVRLPNENGRSFAAKVTYIQPQMDPATRTLKVRLEADNPGMRLKPDMFASVEFQVAVTGRISIPADAVVNTGLRKTVFVDHGNGNLEKREVETGDRVGEQVQVLSGLRAGERVVAAGAFLIDSEAQLKAGAK